ncbi:hypothetical protein [Lacticaseibacillus parakribbianus]|uniref:hypothetical protein n=1 Tax=Lacticaseibacillus parakribbianus TaxID=2970927 RepID=UPI0021CB16EB|nr:hypothetical protein [Lacticaseibacillus parakribbianus]
MKALVPGETCHVIKYHAAFPAVGVVEPWYDFHGVVVKVNENSAIIDVSKSPELTKRRIHATGTGRINVSVKHIAEKMIPGTRGNSAVENARAQRMAVGKQVLECYRAGLTRSQTSKKLGRTVNYIIRCETDLGIACPQEMSARALKPDGTIQYFANRYQPMLKLGMQKEKLTTNQRLEIGGTTYETGHWVIFEGVARIKQEAAK